VLKEAIMYGKFAVVKTVQSAVMLATKAQKALRSPELVQ
jgi:hypothetical protein